jgi:hypothetical protein
MICIALASGALLLGTRRAARRSSWCRMSGGGGGSSSSTAAAAAVQRWLDDVILKHGLCPWAPLALRSGGLRIVTSHASDEESAFEEIVDERDRLFGSEAADLSTTLLVCPSVEGWQDDFDRFDRFVSTADAALQDGPMGLSLVAFHPCFARWRHLPEEVLSDGAEVWAYYEEELTAVGQEVGYRRSESAERATVLDVDEASTGVRKVAVRFKDDGAVQLLPMEWVVGPAAVDEAAPATSSREPMRPLLADNWLHACPVPMVHLLRGEELGQEALRAGVDAIDELQRRNAQIARERTGLE